MALRRIYQWAQTQPDKAALIFNGSQFTYATFARAIDAARKFQLGQNLPVGSVAIVLIQNLADAWINIHALRSVGLTTIAVPSLAAAHDLAIKNVACVVTTQAELSLHGLHGARLGGTRLVVIPNAIYHNLRDRELPQLPTENLPFGGHILYTSGTTGRYKKVLMRGDIEVARNEARAHSQGYDKAATDHGINFGIWSGAGFKQPSAIWHAGGTQIIDQRPDAAEHFLDHPFTKTGALPVFWQQVLAHRETSGRPGPTFDFEFSHSGGFLAKTLADRIRAHLTANMLVVYSATEFIRVPLKSFYQTVDDLHWLQPVPGCLVEIAREDGSLCRPHEEGLVRVLLSDIDATGYLDDPEATARFFRDGFFYPGDIGIKREDGAVRILGRVADVLNVRGDKLAVGPLEQQVQDLLHVETLCLFSGLSREGVDELVVVIESDRTLSREDMQKVAARFPQFERVRFENVQKFPRTEAGMQKIKRGDLRKLVFAG